MAAKLNKPAPPTLVPAFGISVEIYGDVRKIVNKMAKEVAIQSEEDFQRMIELGAWYDGDEESSVASAEIKSETEPSYNRNKVYGRAESASVFAG